MKLITSSSLMLIFALSSCSVLSFDSLGGHENFGKRYARHGTRFGPVSSVPGKSGFAVRIDDEAETLLYPPLIIGEDAKVEEFVHRYTTRERKFIEEALEKRKEFMPILESIFQEQGLPVDLVNIAIIESRLEKHAKSPDGAVGMWQFTKDTARAYGLTVNFLRDDRKHVSKSTTAAARYLADLYDKFGDWSLVLAAYNGGPGKVSRAMQSVRSDDFNKLASTGSIRAETRNFVAKVMAVTKICRDPEKYGFEKTV